MTVIAAIHSEKDGCTYIGSDTQAIDNETRQECGTKWVVGNGWAVGQAGSRRTFNILQQHKENLFHAERDIYGYAEFIRKLLIDNGYNTDTEEGPPSYGEQFIIASNKEVFSVCTAFSITKIPNNTLWADGSGRAYALGAGSVDAPDEIAKLTRALMAAIKFDSGCGGETWVRKI